MKENSDWDDLNLMINDMKSHALNNGVVIISYDRPKELRIGYKCESTNKEWTCRITTLKRSLGVLAESDPERASFLSKAVSTQDGRLSLLKEINGK